MLNYILFKNFSFYRVHNFTGSILSAYSISNIPNLSNLSNKALSNYYYVKALVLLKKLPDITNLEE